MPDGARPTIRQVPFSDSDRAHASRLVGAGYATNWGCLLAFAALVGTGLVLAGRWGASFLSAVSTEAGGWIGLLLAAILLGRVLKQAGKGFQDDRRRAREDLEGGVAEEIEVHTSAVALLGEEGTKSEPRLAFDLGEDRVLVLAGFWLQNPARYGVPRDVLVEARRNRRALQGFLNRLPPPWSFPCTEFTLRRLPVSGVVLSVELRGEACSPEFLAAPGIVKCRLPESLIVTASLDDLDQALKAYA